MLFLGVFGLFYAGWVAFPQPDAKRLVAYSSIAHMGIVIIGLSVWNALTLGGAVVQMINHGLSTSALFIMIGMLDERLHSRAFADMGGLWRRMPIFSGFFLLFAMSSMGLPGLNNFVGEILVLIGTYKIHPVVSIFGFTGLVLTLVYILRMVQEALFRENQANFGLEDLDRRETLILGALALAVVFIGLVPGPLLDLFQEPVRRLLEQTPPLVSGGHGQGVTAAVMSMVAGLF